MAWKKICSASDVPANQLRKFEVGGVPIVVANYGEGFRAIPPLCPHMEEPLEDSGAIADCMLTCTKHLWQWDLRTLDIQGEAEKPLKAYDCKVEAGNVMAFVDQEIVYDFDEDGSKDDDDFWKS